MFRKSLYSVPCLGLVRDLIPLRGAILSNRFYHGSIEIRPDIRAALKRNEPIVALESTIITHGMPYPENFETARQVEKMVATHGALPATIAVVNGVIKVGLQRNEMKMLARRQRQEVIKCSRRDLPYVVAMKKHGGTTVAATMIIAEKCGIRVFATGGIGGVHRNGQNTMDVSADLTELGRTQMAVVSSGVKSILDIERTLEFLETQGVCVATYGSANGKFPDFFTSDSGFKVPYNCPTAKEAAQLINALHQLELKSGILIAVPIPSSHEANKQLINEAIDKAIHQAERDGINGKDVTPYILQAVNEATGGQSLEANKALILNNAKVAAEIACELSKQIIRTDSNIKKNSNMSPPTVIGGSIFDLSMTLRNKEKLELKGATYSVKAEQSAGGVGRNIAEGLYKLHGNANFITAIGSDHIGNSLMNLMPDPLKTNVFIDKDKSTSMCTLMFDHEGDCKIVAGNMEIHESITPELLFQHENILKYSPLIVFDANLSLAAMEAALTIAKNNAVPVFFEPTDMLIANKPFQLPRSLTEQIKIISPNLHELFGISQSFIAQPKEDNVNPNNCSRNEVLEEASSLLKNIASAFDLIIVTLGHHGVLLSVHNQHRQGLFIDNGQYIRKGFDWQQPEMIFYPAPIVQNIINVSGAGDSFNSGFISELLKGSDVDKCVAMGFVACQKALQSHSAVPDYYFVDDFERDQLLKQTLKNLQPIKI